VQVVFCAGFNELTARFPDLPQRHDSHQLPGGSGCIDLTIEVGPAEILTRADLENLSVAETLSELGRPSAAATVAGLIGRPMDDVVAGLAHALRALFTPQA
jgi:hypothetical protein